ncbi:MAG TPA: type II toxin-antitoxin system RelE/ParE family toxin [Nitrospira sp.]|mgnify:FL=1|nr:type II toxin-antitoxin system RelE/ParE family toxin [Nitrospira sp.]HNP80615.1 type II toxin-antitoxin system RelE/ParE family toxin [Nitrospira sp.]
MTYQLLIKPSARKELEQLSDSILRRIDEAIVKLSNHPRPVGSKKLVGAPLYRIRIGTYRVVYEIDDNRKTVTIVTVGHRGDVYR